jgi:hypothetical protein
MDLHLYRNSHDRWHDLRAQSRERGAVLAVNALTLAELVQKLTPDLKVSSTGQQIVLVRQAIDAPTRYAFEAVRSIQAVDYASTDLLGSWLDAYRAESHRSGLRDPHERCWLAAARVYDKASAWLKRFERVVLHAIYDLSEAEFALVRNVIDIMPQGGAIVLFNATANVRATQFAEYTWQRFIKDECLAENTFPEFCRPSSPNGPLLERLFDFRAHDRPLEPLASLRIVQAQGRYREVEFIGSEIRQLLDRGHSAHDIAVAVRHIETYGEMIEDVLLRYRVPHVFETGVPLLRIPFIKYWFAFLDLVTGERSRAALARVMSSAYFEPRLSPAFDVERQLAGCGYIDRHHLPASDLARRKHSALAPDLLRLETRLDGLAEASQSVLGFLSRLQPPACLTVRDRQAWRALFEELESADGIAGSVSFEEFRRLALEIAAQRTVDRSVPQPVPPGSARVRVISPAALGSREFRWIFAPGIADGEFPARSVANPLLTDEVIERINAAIKPRRLLNSRDRHRIEPLYLFMLLDCAQTRVTLTFPGSTLEGEPITPSAYIGEIGRHFAIDIVERLDSQVTPRDAGELRRQIAAEWRNGRLDDSDAVALLDESIVRRVTLENHAERRASLGEGELQSARAWHPSELNALASCPFVYLSKYRLNLRTEQAPDFEIPPMEIGRLAHDVLREFYSTPIGASEAEAARRMDEIIRRRLADADISGQAAFSVFDPSLWKIRRVQLVAALRQYVRFAVRDAFDGFETLTDYLDSKLPPALLGSILLAGRPDHVAVRRIGQRIEGIRVDDFKYSAAGGATAKLLKDSFQIPVYAWLAAAVTGADASTQIEGRYLLLRSPRTPVVATAIDPVVFDEIRQRIDGLVQKVRSGQLQPAPADRQECPTCDYRRLCRF